MIQEQVGTLYTASNLLARQHLRRHFGLRITFFHGHLTRLTHCSQETPYAQFLCLSYHFLVPDHFKYSKHKEIRHRTIE